MYTCIHVYIHIYIYIHISLYIYIDIYLYVYICIYAYIYICIHICIYLHIYVDLHICTNVNMFIRIMSSCCSTRGVRMYVYMSTCVYTCIYVYRARLRGVYFYACICLYTCISLFVYIYINSVLTLRNPKMRKIRTRFMARLDVFKEMWYSRFVCTHAHMFTCKHTYIYVECMLRLCVCMYT